MDKIKEKPRGSSAVREKGVDAVRRGLEGGADRLRTQLRDAAQQGQRDEYGGDQIEDAAACAPGRVVRAAEGLARGTRTGTRRGEGIPSQKHQKEQVGTQSLPESRPGRPPLTEQAAFPLLLKGRTGRHSPPRPSLDVRRRATKGPFLPQARRAAQP